MDARLTQDELKDVAPRPWAIADAQLRKAVWEVCVWVRMHDDESGEVGWHLATALREAGIKPWPDPLDRSDKME